MERHYEKGESQRPTFETEFAKVKEAERELAEVIQEIKGILSTMANREETARRLDEGDYLSRLDAAEAKRQEAYDQFEAYLEDMGERLGADGATAERMDATEDEKLRSPQNP